MLFSWWWSCEGVMCVRLSSLLCWYAVHPFTSVLGDPGLTVWSNAVNLLIHSRQCALTDWIYSLNWPMIPMLSVMSFFGFKTASVPMVCSVKGAMGPGTHNAQWLFQYMLSRVKLDALQHAIITSSCIICGVLTGLLPEGSLSHF